jgi:hypothetical protein
MAGAAALAPATAVAADGGLTLSASGARLGPGRTTVVLEGTYSCGPFASGLPDRGVLDLTVQQVRRGRTVTALGYLEPTVCDGTAQDYAATLTTIDGARFTTGPATWTGSGYVEGDSTMQHVHVGPEPITLTR